MCTVCTYLMWLHYYVLKDMCLGVYFQDAFVCYGHGSSELIILNHHFSSIHGIELTVFMCWNVIVANLNIWTVVALRSNNINLGLYIFFLPFKYKVEYAVVLFPKKGGESRWPFSPIKCFRIIRSRFVHKSQLIMDIVISITL